MLSRKIARVNSAISRSESTPAAWKTKRSWMPYEEAVFSHDIPITVERRGALPECCRTGLKTASGSWAPIGVEKDCNCAPVTDPDVQLGHTATQRRTERAYIETGRHGLAFVTSMKLSRIQVPSRSHRQIMARASPKDEESVNGTNGSARYPSLWFSTTTASPGRHGGHASPASGKTTVLGSRSYLTFRTESCSPRRPTYRPLMPQP